MADADLPPRLSEQQQFILAYLRHSELSDRKHHDAMFNAGLISARTRAEFGLRGGRVGAEPLSRAVALEFDEDGERISQAPDPAKERIERALDRGRDDIAAAIVTFENQPDHPNERDRYIKPVHSASISRSLTRLAEREPPLIDRRRGPGSREPTTTAGSLTAAGREAGAEVLRRIHDGRYSLSFETIEAADDPDD